MTPYVQQTSSCISWQSLFIQTFSEFCGTANFTIFLTRASQWPLSWNGWIESTSFPVIFKIYFNIIFPATPRFSKRTLSYLFSHQDYVRISVYSSACHVPPVSSSHFTWSWNSSLCRFLCLPLTFSFLGPNILLNTLFSIILSLRSFVNVTDQVLHPYKATCKIVYLRFIRNQSKVDIAINIKILSLFQA